LDNYNEVKMLWSSKSKEMVYQAVGTVLNKVDTIRFMEDYNRLLQRDKGDWMNLAYINVHAATYENLTTREQIEKLKEEIDKLKAWKKEAMIARNWLYQQFLEVCDRLHLYEQKAD
jgi:hypothetical protein